jgi:hypothetical protein
MRLRSGIGVALYRVACQAFCIGFRHSSVARSSLKRTIQIVLIVVLAVTVAGCKGRREGRPDQQIQTETINPAEAKPEEVTPAEMTQTVDIEDSRSEAEGGAITSPNPPVRTGTSTQPPPTTTTATTTSTTAPPPRRRP